MPCYSPLKAYKSQSLGIVFREPRDSIGSLSLPCSQCVGCRLERSRQWAVRCAHEASLYRQNSFITLTYKPECLPPNGSLVKEHFQKFMKRLRKRFDGYSPTKVGEYWHPDFDVSSRRRRLSSFPYSGIDWPIRFYMCGEYGGKLGRPHYHACLFNFDFPDKVLWGKSPSGEKLYRSASLEELWPFGFSSIGSVTFQSAAYVARYIMKKITGSAASSHYETVDEYGVVDFKLPEYNDMSRSPGIGSKWFDEFSSDVYPSDFVVMRGSKVRPPRYYDLLLEKKNPQLYDEIKQSRVSKPLEDFLSDPAKYLDENNPSRLRVKLTVLVAKLDRLKRNLS